MNTMEYESDENKKNIDNLVHDGELRILFPEKKIDEDVDSEEKATIQCKLKSKNNMKHLQDFLEVAKMITNKVGSFELHSRLNKNIFFHSLPNENGYYVVVEFGHDISEKGSLKIVSSAFSGDSISCKVTEDASLFIDELWEEMQLNTDDLSGLLDTQLASIIAKEREELLAQQEKIAKQLETLNK